MLIGKRTAIAAVVLGLAAVTAPAVAAEPRATAGEAEQPRPSGSTSVTLLTGDRVVLLGKSPTGSATAIQPAAGREHMRFSTYTSGSHQYVIPADAARPIATGQLDRRLFDIPTLIDSGYDDASTATLPVIVTYRQEARRSNLAADGGTAVRELPSINGTAVEIDKTRATGLWNAARDPSAGVKKVWLDGRRTLNLDRSVPQIGAPAAWAAGYTGAGVKIAVLDTGVDQTHPDLAGREAAEQNFSNAPDAVDRVGHGTHVASTAAGAGPKYRGVAPGATVLDGKVFNDKPRPETQDSWIIAGMQWAAEQGATVVNMSFGGPDGPETDKLEEAVATLSAQKGILFVISAGNSGAAGTVGSPGSADAALTVGAVDRDESLAGFSSRGPRVGDGAIKPDITAPGVNIAAAKAANGFLGRPVEPGYVAMDGTSMAAPHVAGAAALLAQQHPDWTGPRLKAAITASAAANPALTPFDQGSGRIDVARAVTQTVTSEPTNVSLGTVPWPHDQPVTENITYDNTGPADVVLSLAVDARGPDGGPAPNGVFTLSANQVTVPAGGKTEIAVTGKMAKETKGGLYSGAVVATAGATTVRTPIVITREPESFNLTINVRDAGGTPTDSYDITVIGPDNGVFMTAYEPDGSVTIRIPKGYYAVETLVASPGPDGDAHYSVLSYPALTLNRDTTVEADARVAKPISVALPDPSAKARYVDSSYRGTSPNGKSFGRKTTFDSNDVSTAHLGPSLPTDLLTAWVNTQWIGSGGAFYGLAWFFTGTAPTGLRKVVKRGDLATVHAEFGPVAPGLVGKRYAEPTSADGRDHGSALVVDVSPPRSRTEYYNAGTTLWQTWFVQVGRGESSLTATPAYQPGHTYHERFNHAVLGPAFGRRSFPWVSREGDLIDVILPLFGDAAGNGGFSELKSANIKLYRNGSLVDEQTALGRNRFWVHGAPADYRLTADAVRDGIFDVTTKVSAAWTFRSGHGEDRVPLPLSAIRFTPPLDNVNAAPAGRPYLVPVAMQRQSGAMTRPARLAVDVSYDEGKTWRRAEVIWNLAVLLYHPADATSVSLRATAADHAGNTVEQTIIRAYKLSRK